MMAMRPAGYFIPPIQIPEAAIRHHHLDSIPIQGHDGNERSLQLLGLKCAVLTLILRSDEQDAIRLP
jgi:hypothetical protein